jgi:hypothetical protein
MLILRTCVESKVLVVPNLIFNGTKELSVLNKNKYSTYDSRSVYPNIHVNCVEPRLMLVWKVSLLFVGNVPI